MMLRRRGLMTAALLIGAPAAAGAGAMVTDAQGQAAVEGGARLAVLAEVAPGSRLRLAGGARLVLLFLASGDEFALKGPGRFEVGAAEVRAVEGATPQKRALPVAALQAPRVRAGEVAQATLVMRSIQVDIAPEPIEPHRTRVFTTRPSFRWSSVPETTGYRFVLIDRGGETVFESELPATELVLPESLVLEEGADYSWSIEALPPGKRRRLATGEFAVIDAEQRAAIERLRPGAKSSFADRVAFALLLEQVEAHDAARAEWRRLAAERSGDKNLKARAASR